MKLQPKTDIIPASSLVPFSSIITHTKYSSCFYYCIVITTTLSIGKAACTA